MTDTTIWKYELSPNNPINQIDMPMGAKVLCVQEQYNIPVIWVVIDPRVINEKRTFYIQMTGEPFYYDDKKKYIGTVQLQGGSFVIHVFEKVK